MIGRLLHRIASAEFIGWLLVVAALWALTFGVAASLRQTETGYLFWVCLPGTLVAFGLSSRRTNGVQASAVMVVLGVLAVWVLGARLTAPLLRLGQALLQLVPQVIPAIRTDMPIDTTAVADAWLLVVEPSRAFSHRALVWFTSLDRNVIVNDALMRNMAWILILWLFSAWTGWFTGRRNALAAFLPASLLLAAIISYSERGIETLWMMVCIMLVLMGVWNYKNHTAQWERRKVDYSDSIRYDVGQAVVFLSFALGMLALITPSISWRQIRDYLRERNKNEVAEMLGVQQQQVAAQNAPSQKPALPRDHLLTGGFANSEKIVMIIRTSELPPVPVPEMAGNAPRHYWRSNTYDTYVGAGWVTSTAFPQKVEANTPLIPGLLNGYRSLHMDVEMIEPEGKLFWSGILFSADVPFRANWRLRPQSSLFADQAALLQADMFAATSTARSYRAQSYVPLVTREELRSASPEYPEEIRKRYLRLPDSVPERVLELAREITKDKQSPYDRAKAIEAYLRTYPYDLEVPAPPEGADVADFFLFDLKKGYCDYYASAMVVLARATGLPARFVSGYAPGSYDAVNAQYVVRELNAHSWVEIYFAGIGWVEFEPTASQPEIALPEKEELLTAQPSDSTAADLLYRFRLQTALFLISPLLLAAALLLIYFALIERWWYIYHLAPGTAVERIHRRLYRLGRPLAGERTRAETAHEFMHKLTDRVEDIRARSRFGKTFLRAGNDIETMTELYQDSLFTDSRIGKEDVRKALHVWKRLRLRLFVARLVLYFRSLIPRKALGPASGAGDTPGAMSAPWQ